MSVQTVLLGCFLSLLLLSVFSIRQLSKLLTLEQNKKLDTFSSNVFQNYHLDNFREKGNIVTEQQKRILSCFQPVRKRILGETGSLEFLFHELSNMSVFDQGIDLKEEKERCNRYGMNLSNPPIRRRIFRGSLIADDSWHSLATTAIEGFGVYEHVVFVESNRTQTYVPRAFRFLQGSEELALLQSGIFGPDTHVTVDYYVDENLLEKKDGILFENIQRNLILKRWKEEGMTEVDIGLLADADESFSRDYLRAAQICDVPQFQPNQSCKNPKISASATIFESSPNCVTKNRRWYHPDMVIGECVEYIGDEKKHKPVPRQFSNGTEGPRMKGHANPNDMKNVSIYPLWNGADFRTTPGGIWKKGTNGENTGWHMHNFFMSRESLRFKYMTYGHPIKSADIKVLGDINRDLMMMVKCLLNISDKNDTRQRAPEGVKMINGPIPLAFKHKHYRDKRHAEMRRIIAEDEMIANKD